MLPKVTAASALRVYSMDAIPTTPKAEVKEEQPVQKGPSRDELKASLKIDSVKKNLLKRVKEYR